MVVVVLFGVAMLNQTKDVLDEHLSYCMCCDNKPCSDTYYNKVSEKCVLTLSGETYNPTNNKSDCYIEALT